jgi:hypothetical protein
MRVYEEILYAIGFEDFVHPWVVRTLREPEPLWGATKEALMFLNADADLRPHGFLVDSQERQVAVGCRTSDDFYYTGVLKTAKSLDEITAVAINENLAGMQEKLEVHLRQGVEGRVRLGAFDLLGSEFDQTVKVTSVTFL